MQFHTKDNFRIALVGVEFEENLSLRYLAGSLQAAEYKAVIIKPYNSLFEAEEIADFIIEQDFHLVGISMAFQVRAIDEMTLVQLLQARGFKGHITSGGQFVTLHYSEIFQDCPRLDSVVRFEAEIAMVKLADTLRTGGSFSEVPSLIWKNELAQLQINNNAISPGPIDEVPWPVRKENRPEYLGFRAVHMLGSRGCHATCKYCCVSALATERSKASKEAGGTTALPGTRRRTAKNVASEIAKLYFEYDIRIFEFQDDNWIPPKTEIAVAYFTELKEELNRLKVGRIGLTLKTRADSVQPETIRILKEIGLIRVFVGIESGTQSLLSKLGRKSRENVSLQALQILREFKIPAYFNALLFGPDIKFEDLEPELEFLEECADFPFEIVEVIIYGKTGLYLSLKMEQRLHGNYLDYDYDYLENFTQITHSLVSKLETRHFGVYSPIKMAADLGFNLGILQVFYPGSFTDRMAEKVAELTQKINEDQVRIIRKAARLAQEGTSLKKAKKTLIAETVTIDLCFYQQIVELQVEMEQYVKNLQPEKTINAYYRTGGVVQSALIASLFFMALGSSQAQSLPASNDVALKKKLVNLMNDYKAAEWKKLEKELRLSKAPNFTNFYKTWFQADSIARKDGKYATKQEVESRIKLEKSLKKLNRQRIKEDYQRLQEILEEHNPKIKIASSLSFYLDENGKVKAIQLSSRGSKKKTQLSPELKATILEILGNKEFYAYEARYNLEKPPLISRDSKIAQFKRKVKKYYKRHFKKNQRRGPMD